MKGESSLSDSHYYMALCQDTATAVNSLWTAEHDFSTDMRKDKRLYLEHFQEAVLSRGIKKAVYLVALTGASTAQTHAWIATVALAEGSKDDMVSTCRIGNYEDATHCPPD